jgi:hypothetical protein
MDAHERIPPDPATPGNRCTITFVDRVFRNSTLWPDQEGHTSGRSSSSRKRSPRAIFIQIRPQRRRPSKDGRGSTGDTKRRSKSGDKPTPGQHREETNVGSAAKQPVPTRTSAAGMARRQRQPPPVAGSLRCPEACTHVWRITAPHPEPPPRKLRKLRGDARALPLALRFCPAASSGDGTGEETQPATLGLVGRSPWP